MEIGKQVYKSVQRALKQRLPRVAINKTWQQIHDELAVGSRVGGYLELTTADRERLRSAVLQATGLDPLYDDLKGDRLAVASRSSNEKLATQPVFGEEIKLFRLQQPIPLVGGAAVTPPGSYLTTGPKQLDTARLDTIVVIENGTAFLNWSQLRADADIRCALALYRGHDDSARRVLDLLHELPNRVRIYAAVDFDPAGFRIAQSLGADALLVPENYPRILQESHLNKTEAFEKQNTKAADANIPDGWRSAWEWIHRHRIAVTQEVLLARGWKWNLLSKGAIELNQPRKPKAIEEDSH